MTQSVTSLWTTKPDELFDRVVERARALLAAEKAANAQVADASRQVAMATMISTQSRTIDDLSAACATLHKQSDAQAAALAQSHERMNAQATAMAENRE